jgi:hypothetical protein
MEHGLLLPIEPGGSISGWAPRWMTDVAPALQEIIDPDDVAALRERNEHLSAYLVTLGILRCAYTAQMIKQKAKFAALSPPPDKGIKAWEAAFDEYLGDIKVTYDIITELYESTSKRISVTQTNLRSRSTEVTGLGG